MGVLIPEKEVGGAGLAKQQTPSTTASMRFLTLAGEGTSGTLDVTGAKENDQENACSRDVSRAQQRSSNRQRGGAEARRGLRMDSQEGAGRDRKGAGRGGMAVNQRPGDLTGSFHKQLLPGYCKMSVRFY